MQSQDHSTNNSSVGPARLAVVIGAMRCGTTTLFQLLQQTPSVCLTRIKECDYFIADKSLYRGPAWYAGLFADPDKLGVDISPNYAKFDVFPGVPEQIHAFNPDARIIYIVRDPIKRALSEYHHQRAAGVDLPVPALLLDTPEGQHIDDFIADPQGVATRMLAFCGETAALPDLRMTVENDRGSVERLPKFWLALRRTRLGDRIRDLVPVSLHKRLKAFGSTVLGRKPGQQTEAVFDPETVQHMRALLDEDTELFRRLTGMNFPRWKV